jgi:hypothetical protein
MSEPTANYSATTSLPPAIPPGPPEMIPPPLEWPDLDDLSNQIATLSTASHTITWHIAIGHAFLAISWEQSASVEYHAAWRSWSLGLPNSASDRHERARHNLIQAALCWSKAYRALIRALSAKREQREEPQNLSCAMDDLEQCRSFSRLAVERQNRVESLRHRLDREQLTTSIAGHKPVLRAPSQPNPGESEITYERS